MATSLEFRSKWAHEALTWENMSSWAHARTPTPKHSCSSGQIKQGHVPTSCGTPASAKHAIDVGGGMIELGDVITELRRELQHAMDAGEGQPLRFELGPVEVEATVVVEKGGGGGVKVRFWVLELGGDAKASQASTQRIKLALQPRLASGGKVWIEGDEVSGER
jgi:Trypsin-co-occurring domain 2